MGRRVTRSLVRDNRRTPLGMLLKLSKLLGLRRRHYFDSRSIGAKTFWEVVSEAGGGVGVVNWWHSWPARPVNGFVISDRLHYWRAARRGKDPTDTHLTYPAALLDEVRDLLVSPDTLDLAEVGQFVNLPPEELRDLMQEAMKKRDPVAEIRFLISSARTFSQVFHHCLDKFADLKVAAFYVRAPDIAQHAAFRYLPSSVDSGATPRERELYGGVVPQAYRFADALVARVVERMGPDDNLIVLSDHGFARQEKARRAGPYGHKHGEPPGILYMFGRDVRHGAVPDDATLYDIAPTLLRLCGFPLALDLEGRCLEEALSDEFRADCPPPEPVDTYGPRAERHDTVSSSAEVQKKMTDHLRALGYLD